jgi:hypothetical protein
MKKNCRDNRLNKSKKSLSLHAKIELLSTEKGVNQ